VTNENKNKILTLNSFNFDSHGAISNKSIIELKWLANPNIANTRCPRTDCRRHLSVFSGTRVLGQLHSSIISSTDLLRNQAIQNQRNSFSRGFPSLFNVETLQAFGALFQIPHYYRKF
jgi:hypothetical protein